jgi:hypothetical protein
MIDGNTSSTMSKTVTDEPTASEGGSPTVSQIQTRLLVCFQAHHQQHQYHHRQAFEEVMACSMCEYSLRMNMFNPFFFTATGFLVAWPVYVSASQ